MRSRTPATPADASAIVDLLTADVPLRWERLFGRDAPVDVDLGAGKGRFLVRIAEARPERSFLAVERAVKYHLLEAQRVARRGLDNVRLLHTSAEDLLFRLLPDRSVATLYVLHPDPWPKKRHHKRRLFQPPVARRMAEVLEPGGRLLVQTDHPEYGGVIREVVDAVERFEPLDAEAELAELPVTGFEEKYRREGRPITRLAYRAR